jgi:acyl-coenzyme A synthetase/AMP-(fatty) acid ligase
VISSGYTKVLANSSPTLWQVLTAAGAKPAGTFSGPGTELALSALASGSIIGSALADLRSRSVLVATREQLPAAVALVELDGVARRVVLCPPDVPPDHYADVIKSAGVDIVLGDQAARNRNSEIRFVAIGRFEHPLAVGRVAIETTEWILLTSGSTGRPKLVSHTLASLAGDLGHDSDLGRDAVWSTFYDIRRYGGLQVFLRAAVGGSSLVLSSADEPVQQFLARAAAGGVTHISGTPSHWRRALMSGAAQSITPQYVRLSGEIADQAILNALRTTYPKARIAHAFASTEAGVAFDVSDGLAGFPASLIGRPESRVMMKVEEGTLRIRSPRTARGYLDDEQLMGPDGFVDTGDLLELRDGRYYFIGRRGGIINVGGLKVHPEEVEAVINAHPAVHMSLVHARRNPITGAVVVADVVLTSQPAPDRSNTGCDALMQEIVAACRRTLAAHKVPASIRFVPALEVSASGKLVRTDA